MKWVATTLGQIASSIQTGPFGSQLHQSDYSDVGTPVVMPKDMQGGKILTQSIARVGETHVSRLSRHIIHSGDILYSRRGDVGRCAYATTNEDGWLCGTGCLRVTVNPELADSKFVFFQLQRPDSVGWVVKHAVGATMLNLNTSILSNVPIYMPHLLIQRRIASILSAYDSLIENNKKQIKLLEEAAQRLYKEWFVDLRFPGHENVKIVDGVPEGWDTSYIDDICDTIGGGTPSTSVAEYYVDGDIPWVTPTDITKSYTMVLLDTEKKITKSGLDHSSARMLPPYSILMTSRASVGYFGMYEYPVCTNQGFISCVPHNENLRYYLLYNLLFRVDEIRAKASGATYLEINKSTFRKLKIVIPSNKVLDSFHRQVVKYIDLMLLKAKAVKLLTEARDRLLPKLMNGEIEV